MLRNMLPHVLAAVVLVPGLVQAEDRPLRVLFIGNSYSTGELPTLFKKVAAGAGMPEPLVEAHTPGGQHFGGHLKDAKLLAKIDKGYAGNGMPWDVVVLQEQSTLPAQAELDSKARTTFLDGVVGMYDRIQEKNPGARIVLFQTWARNGKYWDNNKGEASLGRNPADMQARLRKWYRHAAEEHIPMYSKAANKKLAVIAPVGDAWERNYNSKAPLLLHTMDHSHPNQLGRYLSALVLEATVFPSERIEFKFQPKIPKKEAQQLQRLAAEVVGRKLQ